MILLRAALGQPVLNVVRGPRMRNYMYGYVSA
jgi:hypothetical protein